jgi:hypothetical protein
METRNTPAERPRALFVQEAIEVSCPMAVVREKWAGDNVWLAPLASAAEADGSELLMRIGPSWAAGLLAHQVRVRLGACHDRGPALVVPIEWRAVGLSALYPVLSGDLEVSPDDEGSSCRVVLSATYLPPLGELGRTLDRAILHRVAESTVHSFLRRLAGRFEERVQGSERPTRGAQLGDLAPIHSA